MITAENKISVLYLINGDDDDTLVESIDFKVDQDVVEGLNGDRDDSSEAGDNCVQKLYMSPRDQIKAFQMCLSVVKSQETIDLRFVHSPRAFLS